MTAVTPGREQPTVPPLVDVAPPPLVVPGTRWSPGRPGEAATVPRPLEAERWSRAGEEPQAPGGRAGVPGGALLAALVRWLVIGLVAWGALGVCDRALAVAGRHAALPGSPGGYRAASLDRWYQEEQQRRLTELERRLAEICASRPADAPPPGAGGC